MEVARRQRNRRINTCLECRRLKRRCSKTQPCTHCQKTARECVFPAVATTSTNSQPLVNVQLLGEDHQYAAQPSNESESIGPTMGSSSIESTPPDMCLRIGKLSITERIGGMPRSNVANEIDEMLDSIGFANDGPAEDRFSAPLSAWFKPHAVLPSIFSAPGFSEAVTISDLQQQSLIDRFFWAVYPVCPLVSRHDLESKELVTASIRLAVMYSAAISLPMVESQSHYGMPKNSLIKMLHDATLDTIRQTDPIMRLDIGIFQATLIYLTPQFLTEVSRSHSIHIGAIVRHFQIARLDKDSEGDSITRRQLKRHMWQHLLFLNQRAVEGTGPENAIIHDHDAQLPSIIGDTSDAEILAVVRYQCYGIHRWVFRERTKVRDGIITLTECLEMLERSVVELQLNYLNDLNQKVPLQKYTSCVAKLLLSRTKGMVLHGVHARWNDWTEAMAAEELRDRSVLISTHSLMMLTKVCQSYSFKFGGA